MAGSDILCLIPAVAAIGRPKLQTYCNEWLTRPIARGIAQINVSPDLLLEIIIDEAHVEYVGDRVFLPIDELIGYIINVLQALAYCETTLKSNAGPETKAVAYCWLLHLVGDLHQPLHCTALFSVDHFPKGDKGGNEIPLRRGKNLHSLWDGLLGAQYYMRNVAKAADELSDKSKYGDIWESATKETDPHDWADESHSICESVVYDDAILSAVRQSTPGEKFDPISLPESYYKASGEEARKRVLTAGLRLGALLNSLGNTDTKRTKR